MLEQAKAFGRQLAGIRKRGLGDSFRYFTGRFYWARRLRRRLVSRMPPQRPLRSASSSHVELTRSIDDILDALQQTAVAVAVQLKPDSLRQLQELAALAPTHRAHRPAQGLSLADAERHNASAPERPVILLDHRSPAASRLVAEIAHDPALLQIAGRYLGGISHVETRLQTSLVCQASTAYREAQFQTVMYHFDVQALNFVYVFFYLSDCDAGSGAHEMIPGSHRRKPLRHLLGSARKTDAEMLRVYGPDAARIIVGAAGQGFVEDTSCYHRARAPETANRLVLQIRYSG